MSTKESKAWISVFFGLTLIFVNGVFTAAIAADWGYDPSDVTPKEWGSLPGFDTCSTGTSQSPIDLSQSELAPKEERVKTENRPNIEFDYHETPLNIINTGRTVEVEYEPGSTIRLDKNGPLYGIVQFHFHAPAEHSFEQGALFDIEAHIVHRNLEDSTKLAVIGVMIKEGKENVALKPVWDHLGDVMNEGDRFEDRDKHINIGDVLPEDRRYFAYSGSLTTPPCAEVVEWRVLRTPIEMSRDQINAFIAVLDNSCCPVNGNNRPIQLLNGRQVTLDRSLRR